MKKILTCIISAMLFVLLAFGVCACGDDDKGGSTGGTPDGTPQQFSGITFADKAYTYDGAPHSVTVSGNLPTGTQVSYQNNEKTDVGTYNATAVLSKDGYETKTLTATLTINKAEFKGVTLADKKFVYFGKVCSLEVEGELPDGTQVTYANNDKKEVGEYNVTATLTNPNYVTKTLSAKMTIVAKTEIALSIINALVEKPEPWSFLPDAFAPENMAYAQMPVSGLDGFATSVSVSQIAKRSIGKQFNVLYEGLCDAASTINKIDGVYNIAAAIAEAYQTFINNNPDDYATFEGEVGGFKIKIVLDGTKSTLLAGNSTVNIELGYDSNTQARTGRVQITGGVAVKYTATENYLKFAVKTTVAGVGNLKQIEFARDSGLVAGYFREFTGTESKNLKTTGVITSTAQTTIIMSNKRETEDMAITGYEEVYSSVTGEYIGGRVEETVKVVNYDTLWLHLADVQGFNSVRVEDKSNGLNLDSVYVNGQNTTFETKNVSLINPSRRFDIEMKEVWYVVAETADGKTEYKSVKTLIPMLFVQTEQTKDFAADVEKENSYMTNIALPTAKIATVNADYDRLKDLFDGVKEEVTYADIDTYIGDKNEFFNKAE
ncbi:MAG: MBG domain-containing protein [Clostridiales bacterium]|nr:MBG domain-containing protein [Clostridiales bacterium]